LQLISPASPLLNNHIICIFVICIFVLLLVSPDYEQVLFSGPDRIISVPDISCPEEARIGKTSIDTANYPYWIDMMQNPSINFFQVQRAFDQY